MRVVLHYDLLRFSPCSIDLFRNEHFSPQTRTNTYIYYTTIKQSSQTKEDCEAKAKVIYFRMEAAKEQVDYNRLGGMPGSSRSSRLSIKYEANSGVLD